MILGVLPQQQAEAPEQLRLSPPMHGHVVPTKQQVPRPEGTIGPLPPGHNVFQHGLQSLIEVRESPSQQRRKIDALRVVIEFPPIDREPWGF